MYDQQPIADQLHNFLKTWGLKAKFVACRFHISENIFSKFMSKKVAFSKKQLSSVQTFMEDYTQRNSLFLGKKKRYHYLKKGDD